MTDNTIAQSANHQAVLHNLYTFGPATYVELELRIGRSGMRRSINYLQQKCMIFGQPEKKGLLRVYEITRTGKHAIGIDRPEPRTSVYKVAPYVPAVFTPARAGAMKAFAIPSRGLGT